MAATTDLPETRRPPRWRLQLASFWRWWTGELGQLAHERFPALRGEAGVPLIALQGDELVLVQPRPAGAGAAHIDLRALDAARARAAFRALLESVGEARERVRLCLGRGESLVRRVPMPIATEENLRQVLGFEMDRLTPFAADDVYFDYRVLSRDAAAGKLLVLLAVARRDLVNAHVERLRALGGNVQGVAVDLETPLPGSPLDLLPSEQRGERETARERLVQRSLAAAVVVLLGLALLIPIWRKRETVIALQPMVEQARQQAEATSRLSSRLEGEVGDYNFLLSRKYSSYPVLAFVEELTRLLPDNTWLQQMVISTSGRGREVQITGETTSSSKLIEILEQSKLLHNATPRGTVTRGSTPNSERFMIAAEARPRPQPEPTPVLQSAQVAPAPQPQAAPRVPAVPQKAAPPAPQKAAPPEPQKAAPPEPQKTAPPAPQKAAPPAPQKAAPPAPQKATPPAPQKATPPAPQKAPPAPAKPASNGPAQPASDFGPPPPNPSAPKK